MANFDVQVQYSFRDMAKPLKPIKVSGEDTVYNQVEEAFKLRTKNFEMKGEDALHERADACVINSINAVLNKIEQAPRE